MSASLLLKPKSLASRPMFIGAATRHARICPRTLIFLLEICLFQSLYVHGVPRWLKLKSSNFELYTSADEKHGRDLILHFEQVRSFFIASMKSPAGAFSPVRIIAFGTDREFTPYKPNEVAAAYYAPGYNSDYIVMKNASSNYYPVVTHEYVHLLVRHSGQRVPLWWNEGLAELYSTMRSYQ